MSKKDYTDARRRADEKYRASTDILQIRMEKGKKERVKKHADKMEESLGHFVNRALDETISRDNAKGDSHEK